MDHVLVGRISISMGLSMKRRGNLETCLMSYFVCTSIPHKPLGWRLHQAGLFQRRYKCEKLCELVGRREKPLWESRCEWEKTDVLAAAQLGNESAASACG